MGVKLGLRTVREEHRQKVIENRVLDEVFGAKRVYQETGDKCTARSVVICTLH
jgi:hypothetical protein